MRSPCGSRRDARARSRSGRSSSSLSYMLQCLSLRVNLIPAHACGLHQEGLDEPVPPDHVHGIGAQPCSLSAIRPARIGRRACGLGRRSIADTEGRGATPSRAAACDVETGRTFNLGVDRPEISLHRLRALQVTSRTTCAARSWIMCVG